jgi:hypothetical protein
MTAIYHTVLQQGFGILFLLLFLSGIMTGLKMLSALNIGISGKRLDMLSIECPD